MSNEQQARALTAIMLKYGTRAQEGAMEAIIEATRPAQSLGDKEGLVAIAGAIALTQWKLDVVLAQLLDKYPALGLLIEGIKESAHDNLTKEFTAWADNRAKEYGIK